MSSERGSPRLFVSEQISLMLCGSRARILRIFRSSLCRIVFSFGFRMFCAFLRGVLNLWGRVVSPMKTRTGKKRTNPPSHAFLSKNTKARVQELEADGRNRAEIAVILASEGYKRNEISAALGLDPRELDRTISGKVSPQEAPVQHERGVAAPIRQPSTDDPLSSYSEQVQFVGRSLVGVSGVSEAGKKTLLDKLEAGKDFYFGPAANPGMLANALTNASIPWYKVHNILTEYGMLLQSQMGPQGQAMLGSSGWAGYGVPQQQPQRPVTKREEVRERIAEMRWRNWTESPSNDSPETGKGTTTSSRRQSVPTR